METINNGLYIVTEHLHNKIDITLVASVTLLGFMIASLAILKSVMPIQVIETSTLYTDIINIFKKALNYLFLATFLSAIGFFLYDFLWIKYISLVAYLAFCLALYYVYSSTKIIFMLDQKRGK
jgi:hypothetical protein